MSKQLPPRPHLNHLKQQAKDLLRAHKAADPTAVQRIRQHTPKWAQWSDAALLEAKVSLQDAQYVIAGEYGFTSWPKLVEAVAASDTDASPDSTESTEAHGAFFDAVKTLQLDQIRTLLEANPALVCTRADTKGNDTLESALGFAARKGHADLARLLLAYGADPNASASDGEGNLPVVQAAWNGSTAVLRVLLEHGADPNKPDTNGSSALQFAAAHGRQDRFDLLLAHGAQLDIFSAAYMSPCAQVEAMLDEEPGLVHAQNLSRTPLWCAASLNRRDVIELLLDRGADMEARWQPYEMTPLFIAATSSSPEALSYLMEKGADLHARVRQEIWGIPTGGTLLHGAAGGWGPEGEIERCVKILLAKGMEINATAANGATALDVAFNSLWVTEEHQRQRLIEFMRHLGGLRAEEPN